eukprot:TRINITY_DN6316_c0_g1_i15.p1 TRINITY_DN6316_c0_g1~~TRINITY_DN6316_c0_g1_i15.p1  ORF type:complete len:295 (-),score=24.56 TRINITY_DN6316_c0_g1_i15:189-1073(-)
MGTYQITLKRKKGRQHQMEPKENASEQLLREGKFYEYELLIKRKFSRLKTKGDKTQTINLLSEGIINLSKNNQVNGVTDLCICLLTFLKEDLPFASTPPIKQIMCEIVSHIPFSKQKIQFVNLLLGEVYPVDNSDLCHAIGLQCIQEDEDGLAQKYFLFDQDNEFVCKFLERWFSKGADGEQAFLVSRFILMKLLTQDIAGCRSIIQYFSQKITSPLINFTLLMLESVDLRSKQAYEKLRSHYDPIVKLDSTIAQIVDKIGAQYFNIQKEGEGFGLGGLMRFLVQQLLCHIKSI